MGQGGLGAAPALPQGHNTDCLHLSGAFTYIHSLLRGMATHCSVLAGKIPWTEEPGRLQAMGLQRVRHN